MSGWTRLIPKSRQGKLNIITPLRSSGFFVGIGFIKSQVVREQKKTYSLLVPRVRRKQKTKRGRKAVTCVRPRAHLPLLLIRVYVTLPGATEVINPGRKGWNFPTLQGENGQKIEARLMGNTGVFLYKYPKAIPFQQKSYGPVMVKWKGLAGRKAGSPGPHTPTKLGPSLPPPLPSYWAGTCVLHLPRCRKL